MGYKLKRKERPSQGILRIAQEQVDAIASSLSRKRAADKPERIHSARKSIKKIRAILRLLSDRIGSRAYAKENGRYRDLGREISPFRDAEVLAEAVKKLRRQCRDEARVGSFNSAATLLQERTNDVLKTLDDTRKKLLPRVRRAKTAVRRWPLDGLHWPDLFDGLKTTYKESRRAYETAQADPTDANLHEWRKRAKDLWYQLRLLKNIWPEVMKDLASQVQRLTEYLGDDHDFAVLSARLQEKDVREKTRDILCNLIHARRAQLRRASGDLGARLYVERPRAFIHRLEGYYQVWHCHRDKAGRLSHN